MACQGIGDEEGGWALVSGWGGAGDSAPRPAGSRGSLSLRPPPAARSPLGGLTGATGTTGAGICGGHGGTQGLGTVTAAGGCPGMRRVGVCQLSGKRARGRRRARPGEGGARPGGGGGVYPPEHPEAALGASIAPQFPPPQPRLNNSGAAAAQAAGPRARPRRLGSPAPLESQHPEAVRGRIWTLQHLGERGGSPERLPRARGGGGTDPRRGTQSGGRPDPGQGSTGTARLSGVEGGCPRLPRPSRPRGSGPPSRAPPPPPPRGSPALTSRPARG